MKLHGRSELYPRDEERAADEDALARSGRLAAMWPGAWWRGTQHAHQRPATVHSPF